MLDSSVARLSSGKQAQNAGDNPSGVAIYEALQAQANAFDAGANNVSNAQNAANVAEGALGSVSGIAARLNRLAIEGSSDFLSSTQRGAIQAEAGQLVREVNTIAQNTNFNGKPLLQGGPQLSVQSGGNQGNVVSVGFGTTNANAIGVANLDFSSTASSETAIGASQSAISTVAGRRATNGAQTVSLGIERSNDVNAANALVASGSAINDLNVAKEAVRNQLAQNQQQITLDTLRNANAQNGFLNAFFNRSA